MLSRNHIAAIAILLLGATACTESTVDTTLTTAPIVVVEAAAPTTTAPASPTTTSPLALAGGGQRIDIGLFSVSAPSNWDVTDGEPLRIDTPLTDEDDDFTEGIVIETRPGSAADAAEALEVTDLAIPTTVTDHPALRIERNADGVTELVMLVEIGETTVVFTYSGTDEYDMWLDAALGIVNSVAAN